MFTQDDNTYRDLREKSLEQWLEEMAQHEDINVRGGVALARGYLQALREENARLKEENELKNQYLKKMAGKR